MTAGDMTMTECAQLPLDHSPSIKNRIECSNDVLAAQCYFWVNIISLQERCFCCWPDSLSFWFNWHSWNHARVQEHFEFSNEESSLGKCHEQAAFWETCGAEIQCMIFLKRGRHAHLLSEYCSSSFLLFFLPEKMEIKDQLIFHPSQSTTLNFELKSEDQMFK